MDYLKGWRRLQDPGTVPNSILIKEKNIGPVVLLLLTLVVFVPRRIHRNLKVYEFKTNHFKLM